jgi:hypothetical protein
MNDAKPPTPALHPLKKLMKVPSGRKNVDIDPAILPQLDLVTLEQTLHFPLCQNPHVKVALTSYENRLECKMSISTNYTDWPEVGHYTALFGWAIATAGRQVYARKHDAPCAGPGVHSIGSETILSYELLLPLAVEDLVQTLHAELQTVLQELPAVYNLLAQGPQPGRTPVDAQEEEEEGDDNEDDA